MNQPVIKFKKLHPDFKLPTKSTPGAAGYDMVACLDKKLTIHPGERALISLGCSVEIPVGYEIQVRPRSGLALKEGITVLNSPGTIDADYRGTVGAIVVNHSKDWVVINPLDRICQIVPAKLADVSFEMVNELEDTSRGNGGFGSTGKQ